MFKPSFPLETLKIERMAIPPAFADLGQSSRDLLSKGYNYGAVKMELKTNTGTGLSITSGGSSHLATGKTNGALELKMPINHSVPFSLRGKWATDNVFNSELVIEDQIIEGAKFACETTYAPVSGKKTGKVKAAYKGPYINSNLDVDFNFAGPTVNGAVVLGYEGILAGYHLAYDTASSRLTKSNVALGYTQPDFQLNATVTNGSDYAGSIFHKVNSSLETAVSFAWTQDSPASTPSFAIGAKYGIDKHSTLSAKINQSLAVGLSYSQTLRPGVKLTLSSLVDAKNFDAGGHQVGLGMDFNF